MLREDFAQRFIDRLCMTLPYNVNIMDPEGVIIACRDGYRKGTYHDIAHRIVVDRKTEVIVSEDDPRPPGVLPGVNLPIVHHDRIIGVVGLTGPPIEVRHVAISVKIAIEQIIDYEVFKEKLSRRQDRKRLLVTMLLYDDMSEREDIEALAIQLRYTPDLARIPVVVFGTAASSESDVRRAVQENALHSEQDMTFRCSDGNTVIFRVVDQRPPRLLKAIRAGVDRYIGLLDENLRGAGIGPIACYGVGSMQTDILAYRRSFHHALWVTACEQAQGQRVRYFQDHVHRYLLTLLPRDETAAIFGPIVQFLGEEETRVFQRTFEALYSCDMSIKQAAGELGVHRNTVLYRLSRIQELLGIDPVHNLSDRRLLTLMYGCTDPPGGSKTG